MLNQIIKTFLLAMAPIGELRAALPVALTVYRLNWPVAYLAAVLGNLAPALFLLLFLEPVSAYLSRRSQLLSRFFQWLFQRTRQKTGGKIKKRGWLALIPFVAIPLPITGAWTGSLAAFLFKIPLKKALFAIAFGVCLSGVVVVMLTTAGTALEKYFGWQMLVCAVFFLFLLFFSIKTLKH